MDAFGRTIDYRRSSMTDPCNKRCSSGRPAGYKNRERQPDHLAAVEIIPVCGRAAIGGRVAKRQGTRP